MYVLVCVFMHMSMNVQRSVRGQGKKEGGKSLHVSCLFMRVFSMYQCYVVLDFREILPFSFLSLSLYFFLHKRKRIIAN